MQRNVYVGAAMPEFLVPTKYKCIFNEYDLRVIKADHRPVEPADPSLYRRQFIDRVRSRYRNSYGCPRRFVKPSARLSN